MCSAVDALDSIEVHMLNSHEFSTNFWIINIYLFTSK